jgi:GxxExxY protein
MNEATKGHEGPRRKAERDDLPFADEVYRIVGAAIEVHRLMGPGFLEAVYQEALAFEMNLAGISFREQVPIKIHYKDIILNKGYICDFLAFDAIVVEIKAIPHLSNTETAQLLNYLRATGKPIGLLINFGSKGKLEWERMVGSTSRT